MTVEENLLMGTIPVAAAIRMRTKRECISFFLVLKSDGRNAP